MTTIVSRPNALRTREVTRRFASHALELCHTIAPLGLRRTLLSSTLLALSALLVSGCGGRARETALGAGVSSGATAGPVEPRPIVIAHRGASGHRPEHTLAAYALAVEMGADYIEPDLVSTKDGVLVARHENEIGTTTDVAQRFPDRRKTKVIDGDTISGWFTEDFTLAELRTVRAKERLAFRSHAYDGQFVVPTFAEVLAFADSAGRRRGRVVGVYPEIKHPTYFARVGLPLEAPLLRALRAAGRDRRDAAVFIQSFEAAPLRVLRTQTRVRLVMLVSSRAQVLPESLTVMATYADAVGANSRLLVGADSAARPTAVVRDAHAAGLLVHVWTLRSEPVFLAARYGGDPLAEVREMQRLGVDGIFGDFPDLVVRGLGRVP
ncbi:MAG: glycerophosphodiester phosphodiesterase [Gemmatimonadaceae bacterium]|nr:glycerophosphodiester phosphodiesterase [Gemmatimonadaceae bacterium]